MAYDKIARITPKISKLLCIAILFQITTKAINEKRGRLLKCDKLQSNRIESLTINRFSGLV